MDLKLESTRKIQIIEPDTLYETYKGLVMDYYKTIFSDYMNGKDQWFYQYYKKTYEDLMNMCNEFFDNEYELNIPFTNACKLYNHMSRDFDKFLKVDSELTKDLTNFRVNYIHIELDRIKQSIFKFKKKEKNNAEIDQDLRILNDLRVLLTKDETEDLVKYINICKSRNRNTLNSTKP